MIYKYTWHTVNLQSAAMHNVLGIVFIKIKIFVIGMPERRTLVNTWLLSGFVQNPGFDFSGAEISGNFHRGGPDFSSL